MSTDSQPIHLPVETKGWKAEHSRPQRTDAKTMEKRHQENQVREGNQTKICEVEASKDTTRTWIQPHLAYPHQLTKGAHFLLCCVFPHAATTKYLFLGPCLPQSLHY